MEERKIELLMEARNARIHWIRDIDSNRADGGGGSSIDNTIHLNELHACRPETLPCAPKVIESMLSSNCDWRRNHKNTNNDSVNRMLMHVLEKQGLTANNVSKDSVLTENRGQQYSKEGTTSLLPPSLDIPPIPHQESYDAFLDALCNPSAADIVMSIQKFCSTIHEAANVMVMSMKGENSIGNGVKSTEIGLLNGFNKDEAASVSTDAQTLPHDAHNYGASLAKAVRGFLNKTMREMEVHETFLHFVQSKKGAINNAPKSPDDRVELLASLERFVYGKCRRDIDMVILKSPDKGMDSADIIKHTSIKTVGEIEHELNEKMQLLQFVSAAHLEIRCLESTTSNVHHDVDLSYAIEQLQSIQYQSSPRQMLRSILLAHRGVSYALNEACGRNIDPPGADDILPTLILATLRARALHLSSALRIIETFAPLPLLVGEEGYAYTNLCGAMQFITDLDVEGHMAEVAILGGSGENSAVLSIGPDEFRIGVEECRRKMALKSEGAKKIMVDDSVDEIVANNEMDYKDECTNDEKSPHVHITARHVRNAREQGEIVDLGWALEEQQISMWQQGRLVDIPSKPVGNPNESAAIAGHELLKHNLPPEEPSLPSQFTRSYSFLTTHPDNISLRDLPQLLQEYKMLVHTTEVLLNERSIWRESERKRLLKLERGHLERDLAEAMGGDHTSGTTI